MAAFQALNCPRCGGSIPAESGQCSFCGTYVRLTPDRTHLLIVGQPCPSCGADTEPGSRFCEKCGATLTRRCPGCGKKISLSATHCPACGVNVLGWEQAKEQEERRRKSLRVSAWRAEHEFWEGMGVVTTILGVLAGIAVCVLTIIATLILHYVCKLNNLDWILLGSILLLPLLGTGSIYLLYFGWRFKGLRDAEHKYSEKPAPPWQCWRCGTTMPAEKKYCTQCQAPRPLKMCPNCGQTNVRDQRFCPSCGALLVG